MKRVQGLALAMVAGGMMTMTVPAHAQDFCRSYSDQMVGMDQRGRQARCPGWTNHSNWQNHYNWCAQQDPRRVRSALDQWRGRLDGCLASRGNVPPPPPRAVPPPQPPRNSACNGLSGWYGSAVVQVQGDFRTVHVDMRNGRPIAVGTCSGNRLTINFRDDRVISGVFNGRQIFWDNRTTWTRN
jgi:hypothetical protein